LIDSGDLLTSEKGAVGTDGPANFVTLGDVTGLGTSGDLGWSIDLV